MPWRADGVTPDTMPLLLCASQTFDRVTRFFFGFSNDRHVVTGDFSPESMLANAIGIDPLFVPRAPMSAENIDVHLLNELGGIGLKRGKLMTEASHPQLLQAWQIMSKRAGLKKAPQLIVTESDTINALTVSPQEVVVTTGLLRLLNFREVNAVLGHELGHAQSNHSRPRLLASAVLGGLGLGAGNHFAHHGGIGSLLDHAKPNPGWVRRQLTALFHTGEKPASFLATVGYMAAGGMVGQVIANHLTVRPSELDADRKGAMISGDPLGLVSALGKLQQQQHKHPYVSAFGFLQSGYPTLRTRMEHLRQIAVEQGQVEMFAPPVVNKPSLATSPGMPRPQVSQVESETRLGTPAAEQRSA